MYQDLPSHSRAIRKIQTTVRGKTRLPLPRTPATHHFVSDLVRYLGVRPWHSEGEWLVVLRFYHPKWGSQYASICNMYNMWGFYYEPC